LRERKRGLSTKVSIRIEEGGGAKGYIYGWGGRRKRSNMWGGKGHREAKENFHQFIQERRKTWTAHTGHALPFGGGRKEKAKDRRKKNLDWKGGETGLPLYLFFSPGEMGNQEIGWIIK